MRAEITILRVGAVNPLEEKVMSEEVGDEGKSTDVLDQEEDGRWFELGVGHMIRRRGSY